MEGKISHSGLLARSPEGHAARGMQIKGNEDVWVEIQANTFRNWVNEHLPPNLRVADLSEDLCTGVRLCALVEALQGHPLKPAWNKRPMNQHHYLENVATALNAIEQDGVKLVNIGKCSTNTCKTDNLKIETHFTICLALCCLKHHLALNQPRLNKTGPWESCYFVMLIS